jgi:hypothetical protein
MGQSSLFLLKSVANEDRRLEDVRRRSGKFGYWLAVIPFLAFWPFFLVHDIFSMKRQVACVKSYDSEKGD